jgi:hypothetical protein
MYCKIDEDDNCHSAFEKLTDIIYIHSYIRIPNIWNSDVESFTPFSVYHQRLCESADAKLDKLLNVVGYWNLIINGGFPFCHPCVAQTVQP